MAAQGWRQLGLTALLAATAHASEKNHLVSSSGVIIARESSASARKVPIWGNSSRHKCGDGASSTCRGRHSSASSGRVAALPPPQFRACSKFPRSIMRL